MGKRTLPLLLLLAACPDRIKHVDPPPPDAGCGDGLINAMLGEECEGSDLNMMSCQTLGYDTGSLTCSECKFVKTLCVKRCGNGVIDTGEACDGDAGLPGCADFGYVSCTPACAVDRAHCVTSAFTPANGALSLLNGGPALVADLPPHGLGDLVVVVQSRFRVDTYAYEVARGFVTSPGERKLSFQLDPVQALPSGDDVVALNRDGHLDRYRFNGTGYALTPYADAGCSAAIVGDLGDAGIATSSCDGGELFLWGGSFTRVPANGGVCSVADFDRDGRLDVISLNGSELELHLAPAFTAADGGTLPAVVTSLVGADFDDDGDLDLAGIAGGASVKLFENTGVGFADRLTIPAPSARALQVADLDLDGRVDLVWESMDKALVRRNQGSWVFAPFEGSFGSGLSQTYLSLSLGDVDGDGDLDLVSTRAGASDTSVSYVLLNRVR